jgi:hypothetical protein
MQNIRNKKVWVARGIRRNDNESWGEFQYRLEHELGKSPIGKYACWMSDPQYDTLADADAYDHPAKQGLGLITVPPLAAIDLDKCFVDIDDLHPGAQEIFDICRNTYAEKSISGKGIHILGYYFGNHRGQISTTPAVVEQIGYGVELFQQKHHVTMSFERSVAHAGIVDDFTEVFDKLWTQIQKANGSVVPEVVEIPYWKRAPPDGPGFTVPDVWPSVLDGQKSSNGNIWSDCPACGKREAGGHNFSYNPSKDVWMCFQNGRISGNALTALAVDERLIACKDAGKVSLKGLSLHEIINKRELIQDAKN